MCKERLGPLEGGKAKKIDSPLQPSGKSTALTIPTQFSPLKFMSDIWAVCHNPPVPFKRLIA